LAADVDVSVAVAVADRYRLVPAGIFGQVITLVKASAGERYEYHFVKNAAEADEAKKTGFTNCH